MKLYKITRTDEVGFDEYDSMVVRAGSKEEAVEVANKTSHGDLRQNNSTVEQLTHTGEAGIILGSFNAG